jgi:negative regulator of sigma E activity
MGKMLAPGGLPARLGTMPWPEPKRLTEAQERRLRAAEARIAQSRRAWATTVRKLGISACARAYGVTPQSLLKRVQRAEREEAS